MESIRKVNTVYIYFKRPQEYLYFSFLHIGETWRKGKSEMGSATSVTPRSEISDTAWEIMRNLSTSKTYMGEILSLVDFIITKVKAHALFLQ